MVVLGFESSCDDTGCAAFCTERGLLSSALHTQSTVHKKYGGVVPEISSRYHSQKLVPLGIDVLKRAGLNKKDIGAIAYTAGPGLVGALLVGATLCNSYAWSLGIPTLGIHHMEGHILSPLLASQKPKFPFIALIVSGGHTQLIQVENIGNYVLLGNTKDDSAGEAFDKIAKIIGLGYPGGPEIARLAEYGNSDNLLLPRPLLNSGDLDFSFSGLKTAVLTYIKKSGYLNISTRANIAAATQNAIIDILVEKACRAIKHSGIKRLVVVGGVGANKLLRTRLFKIFDSETAYFPPIEFCTDNGVMIALAAAERIKAGLVDLVYDSNLTVFPKWKITDINIGVQN